MNDLTGSFYLLITGMALGLSALGLGAATIMPGLDRWSKRFFIAFFVALALLSAVSLLEILIYGKPDFRPLEIVVSYIGSLLYMAPVPMLTFYLLHCCGEDLRKSALLRIVIALVISYIAMLNLAQFTNKFYTITPDTQLVNGPWYPLSVVPFIAIMAINLGAVLHWRKRLSRKMYCAFLIALVPLAVAMTVHAFVSVYPFIDISLAVCAVVMYGIILSDQLDQHMRTQQALLRQQQEIARQRASILMLQMRPHFIYNTMTSVYYLCDQDPQAAKQVTLDFITYLRKNFNAIASEHTIPFSEELEHTRAYLAVEQAQFRNRLFVDYDTPHTGFHLPPLTLQPIVENAVKHGLDPDSEPLRILIMTRQTDSGSEITVEDNGPGFEPTEDDAPHIALANIRQRLEMMCNGRMDIAPREGGGTVVRVTIEE